MLASFVDDATFSRDDSVARHAYFNPNFAQQ